MSSTKISKAMVESAFDRKDFFPLSSFNELISSDRISLMLESYPKSISNDTQKVIAILLYMDSLDCFESLYKAGLRDEYLPLDLANDDASDNENDDDDSEDNIAILRSIDKKKTFAAPSIDGPRFIREQWFFLSPSLGGLNLHEINPGCILPITFKSKEKRTGSYSSVFNVKIHPAHLVGTTLTTHANTEPMFALKQLISDSEQEFKQEEDALRIIHRLEHDHLIRVVSSFRRGQDYFFLFPWAEEGDLWRVWEKKSSDKRTIDVIKWVFEQIEGIASGVQKLHFPSDDPISEENCRHGDLRPQNILLFLDDPNKPLGTLRITDVGLAKIHERRTEKRTRGTTTSGGDLQYAPPKKGEKRSRKYDIWSLGCIFLEFVIWALGGIDEVNHFQTARGTAYSEYHKGNKILPEVTRWINNIRKDDRCRGSTAFQDLLDLVEQNLLEVNEERRYDANQLDARLCQILKKIHKSDEYLLNNISRSGFVPSQIQHRMFVIFGTVDFVADSNLKVYGFAICSREIGDH